MAWQHLLVIRASEDYRAGCDMHKANSLLRKLARRKKSFRVRHGVERNIDKAGRRSEAIHGRTLSVAGCDGADIAGAFADCNNYFSTMFIDTFG
jgi:hypothetical protein